MDELGLAPAEEYGLSALFHLHRTLADRSMAARVHAQYLSARRLRRVFGVGNLLRHVRKARASGPREALHALRHNLGRAARILRRAAKR